MMTTWPWLAVEASRYVHFAYSICTIFIMAHVVTVIIFSCSRKKEVKKLLTAADANTGSISGRATSPNPNQTQTPPQNDKIPSIEKEKPGIAPIMSPAKPGSEAILPSAKTQLSKENAQKPQEEKVEKKTASKKETEKSGKPPLKQEKQPQQNSRSTNLKADQERSKNITKNSSNSKLSGLTGETKAIRSGGKTEETQSEVSKTQSLTEKSKKSSRSKKSKHDGGKGK